VPHHNDAARPQASEQPPRGPPTLPPRAPPPRREKSGARAEALHPPLSPGKALEAGSSPLRKTRVHSNRREPTSLELIPQFFFPEGKPPTREEMQTADKSKEEAFAKHPGGLPADAFAEMAKAVLQLPTCVGYLLFDRLAPSPADAVTAEAWDAWVERTGVRGMDRVHRLFQALKKEGSPGITMSDLEPLVRAVINKHPGLEFLKDTPEFQDRYQETVVYRIFYHVNRSDTGSITLKELRAGDLLDALQHLDEEEDINKVLRFFSYEHFYVVYCKFWELDQDHDFMIDREDLLRYGNHALTYRIVDRIFDQVPRRFKCSVPGKMGYEDFCWFIFSEEDKSTDVALSYWFRCVALDCDGVIRPDEMLFFYEEQVSRMESLIHEPVLFEDILCQLCDMLHPKHEGVFTMRDLKSERHLAGILFNCLFNINKFVAFETRDPFLARQSEDGSDLTPWDRFASAEYIRLALEEEDPAAGGEDEFDKF